MKNGTIYQLNWGTIECDQRLNSEECGWHNGAYIAQNEYDEFRKKYPFCEITINEMNEIGDGLCTRR